MSDLDTGVLARNWLLSRQIGGLLGAWFGNSPRFVDLAGGDGIFVRLMRDLGLDYYWDDPYTPNRFARYFDMEDGVDHAAATAIEVMEHVPDPIAFIRDSLVKTSAKALVLTTVLYEGEVPATDWWYYQFETGQHISFMTRNTLQVIADTLGCRLYSRGSLHVFARCDLSPVPFRLATSRLYERQLKWVSRHWVPLTGSDSERIKRLLRGGDTSAA